MLFSFLLCPILAMPSTAPGAGMTPGRRRNDGKTNMATLKKLESSSLGSLNEEAAASRKLSAFIINS